MRSVVVFVLAVALLGCSAEGSEEVPALQIADQNQIEGTVLETLDASNYTYLRLETANGEAWAAVPQTDLAIGARAVIVNPQAMRKFESKTLGRQFETIYFGTLEGQGASSPMVRSGAKGVDAGPIEVAKAEGATGRTVAELYAEMGELSGKTVTLRGKVVKYNAGIMDRNWIHLQDGTGDSAAGTHDITVTTSGTTAVGEVILVEGTVAVDKDFGAGYRYAVIVEEASVK